MQARVVCSEPGRWWVSLAGACEELSESPRFALHQSEERSGACVAPMPGKIVSLEVAVGDEVKVGDLVAVMEAMKLEHRVRAAHEGVVQDLCVEVGTQVQAQAELVVIESR